MVKSKWVITYRNICEITSNIAEKRSIWYINNDLFNLIVSPNMTNDSNEKWDSVGAEIHINIPATRPSSQVRIEWIYFSIHMQYIQYIAYIFLIRLKIDLNFLWNSSTNRGNLYVIVQCWHNDNECINKF